MEKQTVGAILGIGLFTCKQRWVRHRIENVQ